VWTKKVNSGEEPQRAVTTALVGEELRRSRLRKPPLVASRERRWTIRRTKCPPRHEAGTGSFPDGGQTVRRKLEVLADHCAAEGLPYADIEKTLSARLEPGESAASFAAAAAASRS
jgi:hypothetical protein